MNVIQSDQSLGVANVARSYWRSVGGRNKRISWKFRLAAVVVKLLCTNPACRPIQNKKKTDETLAGLCAGLKSSSTLSHLYMHVLSRKDITAFLSDRKISSGWIRLGREVVTFWAYIALTFQPVGFLVMSVGTSLLSPFKMWNRQLDRWNYQPKKKY